MVNRLSQLNHSLGVSLPQRTDAAGERFLTFPLTENYEGLVPLEALQGAVQVPLHTILPIPETPSSLLGIFSWRGEAVWTLDLAYFLGQRDSYGADQTYFSVIAQHHNQTLALLVEKFRSVEIYNPQQELLPMTGGMLSPETAQFFRGYFRSDRDTPQFLLNLDAIFTILDN